MGNEKGGMFQDFHLSLNGLDETNYMIYYIYPDLFETGEHTFSKGSSRTFQGIGVINSVDSKVKSVKQKKFGRAVLFDSVFLLVTSIKYWAKYSKWIEDWQFELTWKDQKRRFFTLEANKFDSNPFITNWSHNVAGGAYYTFARYHRLSTLGSFLFNTASSLFWEYFTEWREVVSVNDNIFTCVGGLSIGEPLFHISQYYNMKPGIGNRILSFFINPVISVLDLTGGRKWRKKVVEPAFSKPTVDIYFGQKNVTFGGEKDGSTVHFNIGFDMRYNTIPDYGKVGVVSRYLKDTLYSEIHFDLSYGSNAVEEFNLYTKALLFGYFKQKITQATSKIRQGSILIFGAASAFDLYKKKAIAYYDKGEYHFDYTGGEQVPQPTEFTDKLAIMNLIGPVFSITKFSKNLSLNFALEAYFDFALVNSMALNEYSLYHDLFTPRKKTTLIHYGYYYGFGYTFFTQGMLQYRNFNLGGQFKYQHYNSVEGIDRFQDRIEDDANVIDSRLIYKFQVGYSFSKVPIKLILACEGIKRKGTLKDVTHRESEIRIYSQIRFSL
jgi:hypothetical protein